MNCTLRRFLVLGSAVALTACQPAAPAAMGSADDEAAIRAMVTAYATAWGAKDPAALASMVTEDYETVLPNGTRITGRAAYQEMAAAEIAMMPADLTMTLSATTDYVRWLSADAAVAGGTWTAAGAPPEAGPNRGSWMGVFRRDTDGQWRMSNGASAPDIPMPAPPPAATTP